MITEEIYKDEREILKVILLLCSNNAVGILKDRDLEFSVRFKEYKNGQIILSSVESKNPQYKFDDYTMRPFDAEISLGSSIFLFQAIPSGPKALSVPPEVKSHPKRKATRISVAGNSFISKMYAILSIKVVDPSIQDSELSQKLHLIINTIESNLVRSENYDIAKISLFDGTEKSVIVKLLKKHQKPFVVFDTTNLTLKDDNIITYEDYVKHLSEEGVPSKEIIAQLDKIKEFYLKNKVKSEAIVPLVFDEDVIGQIRVVSLKNNINKSHVLRLKSTADTAVDNLFTKCAFEVVANEPQTIMDMSVYGAKFMVTEPNMYKYMTLMRRVYIQLYFPDQSIIKTMSTIVNVYPPTDEGYNMVGVKFSANMDWKDKQKLDNFIQSVVRLQKTDL